MSILLGTLAMGRAHAETRFTETVRVGEVALADTPDPVSLDPVREFIEAYDGPGRVKFVTQTLSERDAAGQPVSIQQLELHLPSGTTGVVTDMFAVVDGSTADDALIGRVFRIKGFPHAGQTTAARFPVEEAGETIPEGS